MTFEYPCFISYRDHREQSELADRFILQLYTALRNELALRIESDLFVDRTHIQAGAFYNPLIAKALCKSLCMIVVYTPTYFSRTNLYCAREYFAMEKLEQQRLMRLTGSSFAREYGLIIPIVLRGEKMMPASIKLKRQYYTFERFSLTSREITRNRDFVVAIRNIADAIHARWQMFVEVGDALTCDCDSFDLPSEVEIQQWLETMIQPVSPFPFRPA